jgi:abortive infection bacteriophage resistance protein
LLRLNYYRFSGYALHFESFVNRQRTHAFAPGTSFDQVVALYQFDAQARSLLFRYIQVVEIAFRSAVCYELAIQTNNPHWYLDQSMYSSRFDYAHLLADCQRECDRSDEIFIYSYRLKYDQPPLPPAWMMTEILSMGCWSRIYMRLADQEGKKAVADHFLVSPHYLESWIHALSVLRNLCAHHARIWNRRFTIRPRLPRPLQSLVVDNTYLAALLVVLMQLLSTLGRRGEFRIEFDALLASFPDVPRDKMGLLVPTLGGEQA